MLAHKMPQMRHMPCANAGHEQCADLRTSSPSWERAVNLACRGRFLESGRHTRWSRLAATDEVAQSLVYTALPRQQLRIAQLGDGTVGGTGLFDSCGVLVCIGPQLQCTGGQSFPNTAQPMTLPRD